MSIVPLFALLVACEGIQQGDNLPPQIVTASAEDGEVIKLDEDLNTIWVQVYDEDPDSLTYTWTLSLWGEINEELVQVNPEGAQVELENDPDLDGQSLTCTVSDGVGSDRIDWTLSVP